MTASIFDKYKTSDILYYVEEPVGGATYLLNNVHFNEELSKNRFPDGTRVAKVQLSEKYEVLTKKELKKVNGDEKKLSSAGVTAVPVAGSEGIG